MTFKGTCTNIQDNFEKLKAIFYSAETHKKLQLWTELVETNAISAHISHYFPVRKYQQDCNGFPPPSPRSMLIGRQRKIDKGERGKDLSW